MSYWQNKVALITGGGSGFGLQLAKEFAARGACVAICGRNRESLGRAREAISKASSHPEKQVAVAAADVTNDAQVAAMVAEVVSECGRIDALVNNAGRSCRGAIDETGIDDFAELLDVNFLGAVRCTLASLPHLLESRGSVVYVGSLAAKVGARYLGAYPASKHPLAAYAQQLRLELGPRGLHILLACPGPIAGEVVTDAKYEVEGLPALASRPGGGAKVRQLDPVKLAAEVVTACERGKRELVRPRRARLLFAITQLCPPLGDWLLLRHTRD